MAYWWRNIFSRFLVFKKLEDECLYDFRSYKSTFQPWVIFSGSKKNQNYYRDLTFARLTGGIFFTEKFDFSAHSYNVKEIIAHYFPAGVSGVFVNYVPAYTANLNLNDLSDICVCGFVGDHYNFTDKTPTALMKKNFYKNVDWTYLVTAYPHTNELVSTALGGELEFISLPWAVDVSVYKNLNAARFYDIACMGALSEGKYPFRRLVREWLIGQRKIKVFKKTRVKGVTGSDHDGDAFNFALNQCRSAFTCASSFGYTLMKYFEIPATGTLLFAEKTDLYGSLGFIDGKHYVAIRPDNFADEINLYLSKEYSEIANQIAFDGMHFVLKNHTWEKRITDFINQINAARS